MNKKYIKLHIDNASDTGYRNKHCINMMLEFVLSTALFCIVGYVLYAVWHIF